MIHNALSDSPVNKIITDGELAESLQDRNAVLTEERSQRSTLIEFPGARKPVPEWRKQLSQRVREVQERKAREAAEELAAAQEAGTISFDLPSAQLELIPDLEQPVMNPIVSKALERLERARRADYPVGSAAATATALAPAANILTVPEEIDSPAPEAKPKLTVVTRSKPQTESDDLITKSEPQRRKPVRVIADDVEDAALSYLETCLTVPALAGEDRGDQAGFGRRMLAGSLDLLMVALMVSPFVAAIQFDHRLWSDPRVIGVTTGVVVVTMFAYMTISVALTGRTLGMRILSLRAIDVRTGLIPTGGQSIKRAIAHIFSLALLGLGLVYGLFDRDRRTIPDRFSNTRVIHT